jgi:molybdenum cofactor guanylyltransferase
VIEPSDVTGLILCGGAGTRFDGRDKPLADLAGRPQVAHVHARLAPQVGSVVVSCNRNAEVYARWGNATVADAAADIGPLAGILAGMNIATTEYLFVCPGDAPFLPTNLVARLAAALCGERADAACPHDGGRRQLLFLLLRRRLASQLQRYIDGGGRSVHGFVDRQRLAVVDAAAEHEAFLNVNSGDDLRAAAMRLSATRRVG